MLDAMKKIKAESDLKEEHKMASEVIDPDIPIVSEDKIQNKTTDKEPKSQDATNPENQ